MTNFLESGYKNPVTVRLNPLETLILLSADENGNIPFAKGHTSEIDLRVKVMREMERQGYVRRDMDEGMHERFSLTKVGEMTKNLIISSQRDG